MGDLDNDMDELFRKAANHYPLKTDGADWDKVMGKLPDAAGIPLPIIEQKTARTNKKLLWLILLFPMGWLCNAFYNGNKTDNGIKKEIANSNNQPNKISQKLDHQNNILKVQDDKNSVSVKPNNLSTKQTAATQTITDITKKETAEHFFSDLNKKPLDLQGNAEKTFTENDWHTLETEATNGLNNEKNKTNVNNNVVQNSGTQSIVPSQSSTIKSQQVDTTQALVTEKKDALEQKNTDTTKNIAKKAATKTVKTKGFYTSAIGGFDASSVKSQGVKKVGYGFGLLIGYQLNKHIAFETGLLWDKKKYYTDGEHFSKTRTDIPSNYYLSDINGICNMFEVPIDFRYNVAQNKRGLFFVTAGLSSYFMKKEAYNYEATAWGSTWPAMKTYNNSGSNLFSVMNLSVGLEHKITKSISVRINPYLKIPLKGLGIGSIPITSSGVNVGITVPFHK